VGHSSLHGIEAREIELIHWSLASSKLAASLGNYLAGRRPRGVSRRDARRRVGSAVAHFVRNEPVTGRKSTKHPVFIVDI